MKRKANAGLRGQTGENDGDGRKRTSLPIVHQTQHKVKSRRPRRRRERRARPWVFGFSSLGQARLAHSACVKAGLAVYREKRRLFGRVEQAVEAIHVLGRTGDNWLARNISQQLKAIDRRTVKPAEGSTP